MHSTPTPARAEAGPQRGLVIAVDGRCSQVEMQGLARAMRLGTAAADLLQRRGAIELPAAWWPARCGRATEWLSGGVSAPIPS